MKTHRVAILLLAMGFTVGCTSMIKPAVRYTAGEVEQWWAEEGKAKVKDLAADAADEAKTYAMEEGKKYVDEKFAASAAKLESKGVDPDALKGDIKRAAELAAKEYSEAKEEGRPLDYEYLIYIGLIVSGIYGGGSVVKGGIRKAMNGSKPT